MKRSLFALALISVPVVLGAVVMRQGGAPLTQWVAQLAALPAGLLVFAVVSRISRLSGGALVAAGATGLAAVACTLVAPDLSGVHRWLILGAVRLNASQLVMPALLVLMATTIRRSPAMVQLLVLAMQLLHWLQPDAGQASSVAAASLVVLLGGGTGVASRVCAGAAVAAAGATWMRADPLLPAPFVEDIVSRAFGIHWWVGCLAIASLAGAVLAPMVWPRPAVGSATKLAQAALTIYFAMAVLVTMIGEFPVPLLGFGTSPILGTFLGLALLQRTCTLSPTDHIGTSVASSGVEIPAERDAGARARPDSGLQQTIPSRSPGRRS